MSVTVGFNIVDEKLLLQQLRGATDREKYDSLVAGATAVGASWGMIELELRTFAAALKAIDDKIGGSEFLPVLAVNNSPKNVLGDYGDCPPFGYFNPEQVHDLHVSLLEITDESANELMADQVIGSVFGLVSDAVREASHRDSALAVTYS